MAPLRYRIFDVLTDFFDSRRLNQRADNDALVQTVTHLRRLHRIGKLIDKLVIDRLPEYRNGFTLTQTCPALRNLLAIAPLTAASISASSKNDMAHYRQLHRYLFMVSAELRTSVFRRRLIR